MSIRPEDKRQVQCPTYHQIWKPTSPPTTPNCLIYCTLYLFAHLDSFASHDDELLGSLHQKQSEFMTQDFLQFVNLLDFHRDSHRVDGGLDETLLNFRSRYDHRVQEQLFALSIEQLRIEIMLLQSADKLKGGKHNIVLYLTSVSGLL